MRQVQGKEVDLARNAGNHCKRLAEIHLCMAGIMLQWHEDLLGPAFAGTDIIRDDRDAAGKAMLIAQTLKNPFGGMALLLWSFAV